MQAKEASRTTWAFAKLLYKDAECLKCINSNVGFDTCSAQVLSNFVYAWAELKYSDFELLNRVSQRGKICIEDFKPSELANFVRGLAVLEYYDQELYDLVKCRVVRNRNRFNQIDLSMICRGFARVGREDLDDISEKFSKKWKQKFQSNRC
eukprot:TRINITY_DN6256_c0_g1_i3.p1 TRINITY_DN6256_c0_g1~~TRINITY_DN6256_c0_g1_i3.p1  ORF type:complete len:151 (+),score=18.39 TRINITY_DN6256_c0_g1_i3:129-581(+)